MIVRTRRLLIRRFTQADLTDFCAYQADPRVREYLPGEPMDVEQAGCDQANTASHALLDRLGPRDRTPSTTDSSCHYELTREQHSDTPTIRPPELRGNAATARSRRRRAGVSPHRISGEVTILSGRAVTTRIR